MATFETPSKDTIEKHGEDIDVLTEWSGEDLSAEDQATLDELANEAKAAREADGTLTFAAKQLVEAARQAQSEDAQAHEDSHWRNKPDSRA